MRRTVPVFCAAMSCVAAAADGLISRNPQRFQIQGRFQIRNLPPNRQN